MSEGHLHGGAAFARHGVDHVHRNAVAVHRHSKIEIAEVSIRRNVCAVDPPGNIITQIKREIHILACCIFQNARWHFRRAVHIDDNFIAVIRSGELVFDRAPALGILRRWSVRFDRFTWACWGGWGGGFSFPLSIDGGICGENGVCRHLRAASRCSEPALENVSSVAWRRQRHQLAVCGFCARWIHRATVGVKGDGVFCRRRLFCFGVNIGSGFNQALDGCCRSKWRTSDFSCVRFICASAHCDLLACSRADGDGTQCST